MATELEKLLEQEKKLKARIQAAKSRESGKERKNDTRRKILIGGYVLSKLNNGESVSIASKQELQNLLGSELKRKSDRELFGLKEDD